MPVNHFFRYFIVFTFTLGSCVKEQAPRPALTADGCRDTLFTFERDIRPIFNANCNFDECHATAGRGSYDFTIYNVVANRIRAGTMEYRLDLPEGDPQHMPDKMRLSKCDYYIIKSWISQNYPEN